MWSVSRRHAVSGLLFRGRVGVLTGLWVCAIFLGCDRSNDERKDAVVMIEAMCEGALERDNLLLHVRRGRHWRIEFARPLLPTVWIAAGTGSRARWQAGDRPAPDVDKIAYFARFFEKILAATTDAKRESGATPGQDELDGIARTSATQMDPVALIDHATGLPTRLVGSVASTSYYWVCELSNEEMKRAFADTNSYLRRVVADGRILEHAPTNLVVFLARQKQGLDDAESWSRGPPKGGKRDK